MATVHDFLEGPYEFKKSLQDKFNDTEEQNMINYRAVIVLQRVTRGYLIRLYIKRLNKYATVIQCAFRRYQAKKGFRKALFEAVLRKYRIYYSNAATKIQAAWRGFCSRKTKFYYLGYRRWLADVAERSRRKAAEAAEYGLRSRAINIQLLENDAREWLALVVFKLHHLLRTYSTAGIYSIPESNELSEFEKLLKAIRYTDYMKTLKEKYDDYVRKRKPTFSNKRLFPIIGDGAEYWYLSLPEMYKLTASHQPQRNTRHIMLHHGPIHKKPFLWKKIEKPRPEEGRGPFMASISDACNQKLPISNDAGDAIPKDPRFHLYVKHYTPQPNILKYVDLQINALIARSVSIGNLNNAK